MFKHELGKLAKDKITLFEGIIIGRANYMFGCNTYGLAPQFYDKEKGKRGDTEWFDEGRIEIIGDGIPVNEVLAEKPGCEYSKDTPR